MLTIALITAVAIMLTLVIIAVMTNADWLELDEGRVRFLIGILVMILFGAFILAIWFGLLAAFGWLALNYPAITGGVCALVFVSAAILHRRKWSSRRNLDDRPF